MCPLYCTQRAAVRSHGEGKDIKLVWYRGASTAQPNRYTGKCAYEVSKVKLAEALWPALLKKIQLAMVTEDAPVPEIVKVITDAYRTAQQRRHLSFVVTEVPDDTGNSSGPGSE